MRILIVEDDPSDALIAKKHIKAGNRLAKIEIVATLRGAVKLLEVESFDVLITDLNLPDASGDMAFRQIAELVPTLPIIILTGNENENEAAEMVAGGAQDYLCKSDLSEKVIRRALIYAIERKALEERLRKKHRALVKAQEELIFAAKMESTGHLAAGIAHEVKNPLAAIQLGLDSLLKHNEKDPDRNPVEKKIILRNQKALERADQIIRELLDFSSDRSFHKEPADLNETINSALILIEPRLSKSEVKLECDFDSDLPLVTMDNRKIEQIIINVLLNAEQAMEETDSKSIRVSTFQTMLENGDSDSVVVKIEDSGPGLSDEEMRNVFDPFYTTKDPGKGTGLGLTVVQRIVQLHEGRITLARSQLGGLLFEISLPTQPE